MYLSDDLKAARRSEARIMQQLGVVNQIFERTLSAHPHWWRRRKPGNGEKPKDWICYFIEFPFRNILAMNSEWQSDNNGRFKKRRELVWVPADRLLDIYASSPDKLWTRVRELEDAEILIRDIQSTLLPA
jgi:hypothetical protein